jgi:hypothetical protein
MISDTALLAPGAGQPAGRRLLMKCWFCDETARGTCAACGRGLCRQHAHIHDEMTLAKSDTSTGYTSFYNVYNALKCSDCRLEWQNFQPGR